MRRWIGLGLLVTLAGCGRTPPAPVPEPVPVVVKGKLDPPAPFTTINKNLIDGEMATRFRPMPPGDDAVSAYLSTDGTFKAKASVTVWEKGAARPLGSDLVIDQAHSGDVRLAVVKIDAGADPSRKGVTIRFGSVSTNPVALTGDVGELTALARASTVPFVEGKPLVVLGLGAGKVVEKDGESLEDIARRCDWAVLLTLTFERRKDSHGFELRVKNEPAADIEGLIYVGASFKQAIAEGKNTATPEGISALAKAVQVDKNNPLTGTLAYTSVKAYLPYYAHTHPNVGLPELTVQRADSGAPWELTAEARTKMAEMIGVK